MTRTAQAYSRNKPGTLQDMQTILCSSPLGTHSDSKGDYSYWAASETARGGTQFLSSAGCLSRNGKIISSYFQYRDPEGKLQKRRVYTFGDSALLDSKAHPGMAAAMRKSGESVSMELGALALAPEPSTPEYSNTKSVAGTAHITRGSGGAPQAPPGYILVPISAISGQLDQESLQPAQPQAAPQQQQQNNGVLILDTVNNALEIMQHFL